MERNSEVCRLPERDFLLKWGTRKRMRCVKVQVKSGMDVKIKRTAFRLDGRTVRAESEAQQRPRTPPSKLNFSHPSRALAGDLNFFLAAVKSAAAEGVKASSPEKSDRVHTRRYNYGSSSAEDGNKIFGDADTMQEKPAEAVNLAAFIWPKVVLTLSSKEKEEDFMAIKGSKLPLRPKKRAKFIQKNLRLVSPGAWLCDLSQERYEVREKKSGKKRPRGLKAMGNLESDSD